ncbi:peptidylprolyl isomerase [Lutimonas zeaxanthinifaciens]|uniref:peptidylprolyl isomerase n=1 Tax=Lutimonas zeaxanthinifaciens TaxID=3060215 RepID=UPI00265D2938|nr:peptidylprolyl isomerase [Lutimonas sp. YSD2104]WKK65735.1 peptidylprolyl isomerase [Lutimonas sp. YSD2104]
MNIVMDGKSQKRIINLRNPVFQFFVIGILLFGIDYWNTARSNQTNDGSGLRSNVQSEINKYYRVWSQFPDSSIMSTIINREIEKEALLRKARDLRIVESSPSIRNQIALATKQFIMAEVNLSDPGDSILKEYMEDNLHLFRSEERYSFEQYYFDQDKKKAQIKKIRWREGHGVNGSVEINLKLEYKNVSQKYVSEYFGLDFAVELKSFEKGDIEILESIWGWHLLKVYEIVPGHIIDFKENRLMVLNAWRQDEQKNYYEKELQSLIKEFNIDFRMDSLMKEGYN